jgi:hypothetical protein
MSFYPDAYPDPYPRLCPTPYPSRYPEPYPSCLPESYPSVLLDASPESLPKPHSSMLPRISPEHLSELYPIRLTRPYPIAYSTELPYPDLFSIRLLPTRSYPATIPDFLTWSGNTSLPPNAYPPLPNHYSRPGTLQLALSENFFIGLPP